MEEVEWCCQDTAESRQGDEKGLERNHDAVFGYQWSDCGWNWAEVLPKRGHQWALYPHATVGIEPEMQESMGSALVMLN